MATKRVTHTFRKGDILEVKEYHDGRYGARGLPREKKRKVCPEDCDICAWDVKGGIDYNGYITNGRNNRKPSEVSKKNQRTDKKRGSSQARHEGGKTARS